MMSAARILHPPLSGRDRRHFAREVHKAEQAYQVATREAAAAHEAADRALARAHRLDCEAWTALQFIGGPADPSPSIADALHGMCELLEVKCRHCNHNDLVDLALVIWPREKPIHTLRRALYCSRCSRVHGKKRRPDLIGLRTRETPGPAAPAAAL
nr:hypothetical protein [uncultured Bradyrhizobium sp.]